MIFLFIMHLMHAVTLLCHTSLSEQVGCSGCMYLPCCSKGLSSGGVSFIMFYFESSESFLLCCIVRQILETIWSIRLIILVLVFHWYVIIAIRSIEIQMYECDWLVDLGDDGYCCSFSVVITSCGQTKCSIPLIFIN